MKVTQYSDIETKSHEFKLKEDQSPRQLQAINQQKEVSSRVSSPFQNISYQRNIEDIMQFHVNKLLLLQF